MTTRPRLARFAPSDPNTPSDPKHAKQLLSQLKDDIAEFRHNHWPPAPLSQIRDLPIYTGNRQQVSAAYAAWQPYFDRAYAFYPEAHLALHDGLGDALPLPSTLGLPLFLHQVERLHLARTHAKESKSFGAVGTLIERCGDYADAEQQAMRDWLGEHPDGMLVAHRAFIDLRAYVFRRHGKTGEALPPERVRFYRSGLIMAVSADFEILDSREKPRKQRSDAYKDPLGQNSTWTVFGRAATEAVDITDEPTANDSSNESNSA